MVLLTQKVHLSLYCRQDVMGSVLSELIPLLAVVSVFIAIYPLEGTS